MEDQGDNMCLTVFSWYSQCNMGLGEASVCFLFYLSSFKFLGRVQCMDQGQISCWDQIEDSLTSIDPSLLSASEFSV